MKGTVMEKSWDQINAEIDRMHFHQEISDKAIFILIGFAVIASLAGWPTVWSMLWFLPALGMVGGLHAANKGDFQGYWIFALGSQLLLAAMVGVAFLIRFGL